ncbi:hypothetical protein [Sphingomicrobium aestuariivivum]|uniref:hypothetical protein n=1 Tax=Sphingomicrobium aestuariivivum TaxID=1582356 RepID=UPI001FD6E636|nr:hypothetical protein [Sphingomicrobium aestuariivivum]MCJ8191584.1 hypothetical protein [Sphingomicrobium aestuariivivum]
MKMDVAGDSRVRREALGERAMRLRSWARGNVVLAGALLFSILAAIYWLLIASDRYVAETHVLVESTDLSAPRSPDLAGILSGNSSGNRGDQLLMRDYLLSRDVVIALDEQLDLRAHYSSSSIDPFSRLESEATIEELHKYYLEHVDITFDDYAGVLIVRPEAFTPEMAEQLSAALIASGEDFMNRTANALAGGQVAFLEGQAETLYGRLVDARQQVIAFQNRNRVASPEQQAQAIGSVIAGLEASKSELEVSLASQSSFLVDSHPILVELRRQIAAIDRQIAEQNARLAGPGSDSLNTKAEQLARLEADATFAQQLYQTALTSLEQARVESVRAAKSLAVIQQPSLPEEAVLPDRWLKTATYAFFAFLFAGIIQLLGMIVRDHKD